MPTIGYTDLDAILGTVGNYTNLDEPTSGSAPVPVDPALMNLRSYFKAEDYNFGASTWTSSASAGDSGTRSVSTLGTNAPIAGTINGKPAINQPGSAGFWLRLQVVSENTGQPSSVASQPDFMLTLVCEVTGPVLGTQALGFSVLLSESSTQIGVNMYLDGGIPTINGFIVSPVFCNVALPLPAYGTPFVLQYGIISNQLVMRFNKNPFNYFSIPPGTTNPAYQNFHVGYAGASLYPGKLGDYYGTIGPRTLQQHDDLAFAAMSKYGIT